MKNIVLSLKDKMMLTLGSFTLLPLFPLRLIILIPASSILIWCSSSLGLIGMDEDKPASGFRRFIVRVCFGFISPKISGDLLPTEVAPTWLLLLTHPYLTSWSSAGLALETSALPW